MPTENSNISAKEAIEALEAVREVERRTRGAIAAAGGGQIVTVWGAVWFVGFLSSHFLGGALLSWLWLFLDLVGIVATVWLVSRLGRRVRGAVGPVGSRIGGLWLAIAGYTLLWLVLASPLTGRQIGALSSSAAMLGYVIMGLWLDRVFLWLGLVVTALIVAGYFLFPTIFGIWMALFGGGALIVAGLRIQRRWR